MKTYIVYILLTVSLFQGCKQPVEVDLIVHDAHIYTADSSFSKVQALAVKDGKFVFIGTDKEVFKNYYTVNPVHTVDAKQRSIYPGFYDSHGHLFQLGKSKDQADLTSTSSYHDVLIQLKKHQRKHKNRLWILGRGWDEEKWEDKILPTKFKLDSMYPSVPVLLDRIDGNTALANTKALEIAGITSKTKIKGGDIELKSGKPTGILVGEAVKYIKSFLPELSQKEKMDILLKAQETCIAQGVTTVTNTGLSKDEVTILDSMQKQGNLKLRVYGMLSANQENIDYFLKKGIYKTDRLHVRAFNISADGSLGSHGALLLDKYADNVSTNGVQKVNVDSLRILLKQLYDTGFQVSTDCVGDSATRIMTNLYGEVLGQSNDRRWRLEQLNIVDSADILKFKTYNIIPSVQPIHCTQNMNSLPNYLGQNRLADTFPYKSLMQQNNLIAFGSDFPSAEVSPIYAFHAAISRQNSMHEPENGFIPKQIIPKENTLKALTIWSAYANFEESERGSIEVGKDADFVILDTDIMDTDRRLLRLSMILNTYISGEKVYSNYESGY